MAKIRREANFGLSGNAAAMTAKCCHFTRSQKKNIVRPAYGPRAPTRRLFRVAGTIERVARRLISRVNCRNRLSKTIKSRPDATKFVRDFVKVARQMFSGEIHENRDFSKPSKMKKMKKHKNKSLHLVNFKLFFQKMKKMSKNSA